MTKDEMIAVFVEMLKGAEATEHKETFNQRHAFEIHIPGKEYGFWLMERNGKVEWA